MKEPEFTVLKRSVQKLFNELFVLRLGLKPAVELLVFPLCKPFIHLLMSRDLKDVMICLSSMELVRRLLTL